MPKVILTDCDEVLFDWAGPFEAWVRAHYTQHCQAPGRLQDYWDVERWLSCPYEESRDLIRMFNADQNNWRYLKPLPKVVECVHRLHADGYKFVAITACDTDEATYNGRWQNLNEVFGVGVFDTLHCVGLAESKREHLARYVPTYWVEDKMKHASSGCDVGHTSFLINYKHNERHEDDRVIRVDSWEEIEQQIVLRDQGPVLRKF